MQKVKYVANTKVSIYSYISTFSLGVGSNRSLMGLLVEISSSSVRSIVTVIDFERFGLETVTSFSNDSAISF